jgi:glycosyltransferase involved in cell wall biosynthesis
LASRLNEVTLACSIASARSAEEVDHVPPNRVRVAHNGANRMREVKAAELKRIRVEHGIPSSSLVVAAVARLRPEKGLSELIAAHPLTAELLAPRELHVVIVGEGPAGTQLRREAEEVAPAQVHFVGYRTDVAPWFALADAVAMPSLREPLGVSGVEAMASGRPLVASAVDGLVEIVCDGKTGRLVKPGDPEALARGLADVLANVETMRSLGDAARARFERSFTIDAMVDAWITCYQDFLPP